MSAPSDVTPQSSADRLIARCDLRNLLIFRNLDKSQLSIVSERLTFRYFDRAEEIFGEHEQDRSVYFIVAGFVRITVYSASGKEVTFRDLGPGEMFGELAAIDGRPRSANAVAKSHAHIGRASASQFMALLNDFPEVNAATLIHLCSLVRDLSGRVYQFSAHAVGSRIQGEILRLARIAAPTGNVATIAPAPTHAEIASRVNTHREAVTREISRLVGAGLIIRSAGKLTVPDIATFRQMLDDTSDA